MEQLSQIKQILLQAESFENSKNYYFENHFCQRQGENVKVKLQYTLKTDNSDKIVKFGHCEHCNTVFYHEDFDSKSF